MESIFNCHDSSEFVTVASKNPSRMEFVDITKFQFLGFTEYFLNICLASIFSSRISIGKISLIFNNRLTLLLSAPHRGLLNYLVSQLNLLSNRPMWKKGDVFL